MAIMVEQGLTGEFWARDIPRYVFTSKRTIPVDTPPHSGYRQVMNTLSLTARKITRPPRGGASATIHRMSLSDSIKFNSPLPNQRDFDTAMATTPFDTLKMARKLAESGFSADQAAGAAEAMAEAMSGAELATKADLTATESRLESKIDTLRSDLENKLELLRRDITIRLGAIVVTCSGIVVAAMRFIVGHS